jgi:DNA-binding Lrp family transcriptional regulator
MLAVYVAVKQSYLERLEEAGAIIRAGGPVEDAIRLARDVAYEVAYTILSKRVGVEGRPSLTEMAYRLLEEKLVDEETAMALREVAMMLEMAHYDIFALYTVEQLIERLRRIESLVRNL